MRNHLILLLLVPVLAVAQENLDRFLPKQPVPLATQKESKPEPKPSISTAKLGGGQVSLKLRGLIFIGSKPQLRTGGVAAMDGVSVESVPLLDGSGFTQSMQKFIGQPVSLDLINAIAAETAHYCRRHDHPVVSVIAPQQDVTNGVVQLIVTEARVGAVRVAGNKWFKAGLFTTRLKPGGPVIMSRLEADTAFYGRNPFRSVTAELAPGTNPGETDIMLHVQDKFPLRVFAGYDNSGVASTGENRLFTGFNYGNFLGLGQELSYQYTTSDDFKQLQSHSATWTIPLPWHDVLQFSGVYSLSNPLTPDSAPQLKGTSWQLGAHYILILPTLQKFTQELNIGYDFKYTDNNLQFGGTQIFDTPIDISEFSLAYSAALPDSFGRTSTSVTGFWSPGGMGSNNNDEAFKSARQDSKANYFYATMGLDRITKLPFGCTWSFSIRGQLSNGNLQATEQFLLGGQSTVRGYPELVAAGDEGILIRNEIYAPPFSIAKLVGLRQVKDQLQFLVFHDFGDAVIYDPLPGEDRSRELQSCGAGLRWQVQDNLSVHFDYGWQLDDIGLKDKSRAHIGVTASF